MTKAFGTRSLEGCVKTLGFKYKRSNSSHDIHIPPKGHEPPAGTRPFFTIQRGQKTYDPYICNRLVSQLKKFGFTKKEIEDNL